MSHKRSNKPVPHDPMDDLKINSEGVGDKTVVTVPATKYVMLSAKSNYKKYSLFHRLYEVFQKNTMRTKAIIQEQALPSSPDGIINLMLKLPPDLNPMELPDEVKVIELSQTRVMRFAAIADHRIEHVMKSTLADLKERGERPTGEIRKTVLTSITKYPVYAQFEIILE